MQWAVGSNLGYRTTVNNLMSHTKVMTMMRDKAIATSCREYIAYKFLLLANGQQPP